MSEAIKSSILSRSNFLYALRSIPFYTILLHNILLILFYIILWILLHVFFHIPSKVSFPISLTGLPV